MENNVQQLIDDEKSKIDKELYLKEVFFLVSQHDSDHDFKVYTYISNPNGRNCFGFLGFDTEVGQVTFAVEWSEMTRRNQLELVPEPEHFILLESRDEFCEFFEGILLTKIVEKRKK